MLCLLLYKCVQNCVSLLTFLSKKLAKPKHTQPAAVMIVYQTTDNEREGRASKGNDDGHRNQVEDRQLYFHTSKYKSRAIQISKKVTVGWEAITNALLGIFKYPLCEFPHQPLHISLWLWESQS